MRERYNQVLEFGLPDWRQPIFYYRRLRKMPWWETAGFMVLIFTVGHYLYLWAVFVENWLVLDDAAGRLKKKQKRLKKAGYDLDELVEKGYDRLSKPRFFDLLPFVIARTLYSSVVDAPRFFADSYRSWLAYREQRRIEAELEFKFREEMSAEPAPKYKQKPRTVQAPDEADSVDLAGPITTSQEIPIAQSLDEIVHTGYWTPEEVSELIRLTNKYPMGTPDRWERISRSLHRKMQEVTDMVGELKRLDPKEYHKLSNLAQTENDVASKEWTAQQQKALEVALAKFPKGTPERWECIAEAVPGKTKVSRF